MVDVFTCLKQIIKNAEGKPLNKIFREFHFTKGYNYGPHQHDQLEVNFVRKGFCTMNFDNEIISFLENDCMIIFPGVEHQFNVPKTGAAVIQLRFSMDLFPELDSDDQPEERSVFLHRLSTDPQKYIKISNNDEVETLMNKIITEIQSGNDGSETITYLYYAELFILISRLIKETVNTTNPGNPALTKVMEFIHQNYGNDLSMSQIAAQGNISDKTLRKLFQENLQMNPIDYLLSVRIQKAKELLANKNLNIKTIAYDCGFSSQQYFNQKFRQYTGMTPLAYKELLQNS